MPVNRDELDGIMLDRDSGAYDRAAKRLLAKKIVLAWIMRTLIPEFSDETIKDIVEKYIEGTPEVAVVPVDPDKTNTARAVLAKDIRGSNNENSSQTVGVVTFDVLFRAIAPKTGELITLIINIEAHKDMPTDYPLISRGVYYSCRLISSQKETEFTGQDFGSIKKVYSIWICMYAPEDKKNCINQYSLQERHILGDAEEKREEYDLINIILLYLGDEHAQNKLMRLLHLLFLAPMNAAEKKTILRDEYDIDLSGDMEKEMNIMCNLGEGIAERAMARGIEQGIEQGMARGVEREKLSNLRNLIKNMKLSAEQAMSVLDVPVSDRAKYASMIKNGNVAL